MATIPIWVLGKNWTAVTIRQQTVGTDGALTDGGSGATALTNLKQGLEWTVTPVEEEINADNSTRMHMVTVADQYAASIDLLMPNVGGDPHPVATLFNANEIFKLVFTYGTGGSAKTWTWYGKRGPLTITSQGRGAARLSFQLSSIDAGSDTVAIA